ncbi:MAG: hypothetical protein CO128_10720 [Ignavibacteriales bacterium CG_4_9_14_3_um_filter_30_11]|nr:MAG: hypothetical protein CO128_10720 [Ignavibacteriales bacterium CG_4_9_14_3_um_filter_30_11]
MKKLFLLFFGLLISCNTAGDFNITNQWFRPAVKGMNTALYFTIDNNTNQTDTLFSVKSNIAGMVQIHETFEKNRLKGMRAIEYVAVKPHTKIYFKPGGLHVMVMNLKNDYKKNSSAEFELYFKKKGLVKIKAVAKE